MNIIEELCDITVRKDTNYLRQWIESVREVTDYEEPTDTIHNNRQGN